MNLSGRRRLEIAMLALAACATSAVSSAQRDADEVRVDEAVASHSEFWPSRFQLGDDAFTVYPLQLERWERDRLDGRAAVAVQPAGADRPLFGMVSWSARTDVDTDSGMVTVHDIEARTGRFPTVAERTNRYLDAVRRHLSTLTWQVSLERLQADLEIDRSVEHSQSEPLRNDPPRIVYVQSPTILVPIDGEPVLREVDDLGLRRVLNTRALMVRDERTNRYFLYVAGYWLEAPALEGRWTEARLRPSTLDVARRRAEAEGMVDLLDDDAPISPRVPKVIVSTGPTELVQTNGPPHYAPIGSTDLLFVTNSPNRLFLDLRTQMHYVLLAGRWYRTRSLARGPWDYVRGTDLPADFALIPDGHRTESVRVAVPGTLEAQEAIIANSVPEFATVTRTAARLEITYDGPPQFRPIEGTQLEAVVNAPVPVIRVDWHTYYALDNGVWFFSDSPHGPWTAATSVPPVVYTIPRSDPLHYVVYVRVYEATPETIYVGYTPGYVGSYVTIERTVVYGSGWYYRPWIGTVWYAPPATWGFGFSFWYSWWDPWPGRVWWAGWRPVPRFHPAWGPWPHHHIGVNRLAVAHHGVAVVPAKVRAAHHHRPVVEGGRDHGGNAFRANRTDMGDIYRRWDPQHVPGSRSTARPDPQRAGRRTRDPVGMIPPPASRQRAEQGTRLNRNQRTGDGRPPRVDAPRWIRPEQRVNPQDRSAVQNAPGARRDSNQQGVGLGERPRVDAPQDRAMELGSPGLRRPTLPRGGATSRAPAAGVTPRSPGSPANNANAAEPRQRQSDRRRRLESQQGIPPEVWRRGSRTDATPPAMRNPRPSLPPRARQQPSGQTSNAPSGSRDATRQSRRIPSYQHESRRDRTRPSAAGSAPGGVVATPPPRRERPMRNGNRGSRNNGGIGTRQRGPASR